MTVDSLLAGGGTAGGIIAVGYVGRLALDWLKDHRSGEVAEKTAAVAEKTGAVTDAATASTVVLASLKALQEENTRQQEKIRHLEAEDERKSRVITELTDRLAKAQVQIQGIADELEQLKRDHPATDQP